MEATFVLYGLAPGNMAKGNIKWLANTIKCALLLDTYNLDQDHDEIWTDVSSHEHSAAGSYPAGGETLTGNAIAYTDSLNLTTFDADDVLFNYITTAKYAVFYDSTTGYLIGYVNFGSNVTGDTTTLIKLPTAGLFTASV